MRSPALDEALTIARERLEQDSDAYADEDIIGQLVAAIDGEPDESTARTDLGTAAAVCAREAAKASMKDSPAVAREFAEATAAALKARELAPVVIDDDVASEMEAIGAALTARDVALESLADFLRQMHGEFTSAQSEVASRWASRIAGALDEAGQPLEVPASDDEGGPDA